MGQLALFVGDEHRVAKLAGQFLADERVDPIYTHPGLCLTVLPHREIPIGKVWERQTGYASLLVHPLQGHDGRMRGVPFGAKARLILLYLMTEAVKTRSRQVELGRSMRAWLKAMGVAIGGNNYSTVADQADRIEHCLLSVQLSGHDGEFALRDSIIRGSFRPFEDRSTEHAVELSEGFFQTILRRPVPIAEGAVRLSPILACRSTSIFGSRTACTCLRHLHEFHGRHCTGNLAPAQGNSSILNRGFSETSSLPLPSIRKHALSLQIRGSCCTPPLPRCCQGRDWSLSCKQHVGRNRSPLVELRPRSLPPNCLSG